MGLSRPAQHRHCKIQSRSALRVDRAKPRLTGTLHMEDADDMYARMHISYWDGGGNLIATRHGGIVQASGNGHQSWSVDLSPINLRQIVEAHVCTELSDDRVDFPQVACETYILD
jgi:hypothetical protein